MVKERIPSGTFVFDSSRGTRVRVYKRDARTEGGCTIEQTDRKEG